MNCEYCGMVILGLPISVEIRPEDMSPESDLPAGDLSFCSQTCLEAYLEEAGVSSSGDDDDPWKDEEADSELDAFARP